VAIFNKTGNLWVTNRGNQSVVEVDGNDVGHVLLMLQNIPDPNGIAIWQAGGLAYVSNRNQGTLSEIDLIGRRVRRTIALASPGSLPWGVAVDEGSGNVYVANYSSGSVACVQRSSGLVFEAAPLPLAAHLSYNAGAAAVFAVGRQGTVLRVSCGDSSPAALFSDNSLFDVAVSSSAPAGTYTYASATDSHGLYIKGSDVNRFLALPNAPYGIEYLGRCVGAVVPAEDRLYVADTLLKGYTTLAVGHQTVGEGGQGIAYAEFRDTVYVTNYADNSLTAIAHPCGP
jgi:DNA-binding beta-propeller fold protein YncE